jgi:hypothetical protein
MKFPWIDPTGMELIAIPMCVDTYKKNIRTFYNLKQTCSYEQQKLTRKKLIACHSWDY